MRGNFFMKKVKLLIAALLVALVASLALAPAANAQPAIRSILADPMFVDAGGEATFTVTGSGWESAMIAVLPCVGSTNYEEAAANGADACDLGALTIVPNAGDGTFSVEVTYDVPAAGMCIGAGDLDQTEAGSFCIGIGAPVPPPGAANTGAESGLIAIIGAAVLAAGALVVGMSRRRAFVS